MTQGSGRREKEPQGIEGERRVLAPDLLAQQSILENPRVVLDWIKLLKGIDETRRDEANFDDPTMPGHLVPVFFESDEARADFMTRVKADWLAARVNTQRMFVDWFNGQWQTVNEEIERAEFGPGGYYVYGQSEGHRKCVIGKMLAIEEVGGEIVGGYVRMDPIAVLGPKNGELIAIGFKFDPANRTKLTSAEVKYGSHSGFRNFGASGGEKGFLREYTFFLEEPGVVRVGWREESRGGFSLGLPAGISPL